jgi:hypothetical protein
VNPLGTVDRVIVSSTELNTDVINNPTLTVMTMGITVSAGKLFSTILSGLRMGGMNTVGKADDFE